MTANSVDHMSRGWTPDDGTFGARLALIRQHMAWGNVKEAAIACGLPPESWRTWERDGVTPRNIVDIAAQISERTGCDYGWLLAGARLREGRTVVTAGQAYRQTTGPKLRLTDQPHPNGYQNRTAPAPGTRRPARLFPAHA